MFSDDNYVRCAKRFCALSRWLKHNVQVLQLSKGDTVAIPATAMIAQLTFAPNGTGIPKLAFLRSTVALNDDSHYGNAVHGQTAFAEQFGGDLYVEPWVSFSRAWLGASCLDGRFWPFLPPHPL